MLQDAAETTALYDVRAATPDMVQFALINLQCCEQLHEAVNQLSKVGTPAVAQKILESCSRRCTSCSKPSATAAKKLPTF